MKFSREQLINIIKEEYGRAEMAQENAENSPDSASNQLEWIKVSLKKIRKAVENEAQLDPRMVKLLATAAEILDDIADKMTFNELVNKHVGDSEEEEQ